MVSVIHSSLKMIPSPSFFSYFHNLYSFSCDVLGLLYVQNKFKNTELREGVYNQRKTLEMIGLVVHFNKVVAGMLRKQSNTYPNLKSYAFVRKGILRDIFISFNSHYTTDTADRKGT